MLDEMLQFRADALDALRQPLESGVVTIARVEGALTLPARFTLLSAFNPCSCGWRGSRAHACTCEEGAARRYAGRLSGPLRDRIDLWVVMDEPEVARASRSESSSTVAARIATAWNGQLRRQGSANAEVATGADLSLDLRPPLATFLAQRGRRFALSPRRLHRAARVARTVADLAGRSTLEREDIDEALAYRPERAR